MRLQSCRRMLIPTPKPIHHAPEVAPSRDTAEVYYPPAQQSGLGSPYDYSSNTTSKPDNYHYYTQNHDPAAIASPYGYSVSPENHQPPGRRRTICGCSALVFMLSAIIAFLSAAVIGLAAGTGIFATKYNDAHSKVADGSSATTTSSATSPTSTDFSANTMGCADHADSTDGDEYKSIRKARWAQGFKTSCSLLIFR